MVLYITMNGKTETYRCRKPFALMYRRANGTFHETINVGRLEQRGTIRIGDKESRDQRT